MNNPLKAKVISLRQSSSFSFPSIMFDMEKKGIQFAQTETGTIWALPITSKFLVGKEIYFDIFSGKVIE